LRPVPKRSRFDKRSAGTTGKKPAVGPAWLVLGLAAVLLAAMTRKAYGRPAVSRIRITEAGRALEG